MGERSRARAQELIEQARRELGGDGLAPLYLLSSEDTVAVKLGEYLQARLAQTLGLDVRLDRQIFKQPIRTMNSGDYDMVQSGHPLARLTSRKERTCGSVLMSMSLMMDSSFHHEPGSGYFRIISC